MDERGDVVGHEADVDRPLDVRLMADDIAALIHLLGLEKPDVIGYSLGGGVALFVASSTRSWFVGRSSVSANVRATRSRRRCSPSRRRSNASAAEFMKDTPMYQGYVAVAPRPEDFGRLLDKIGAAMAQEFDYSDVVRGLQVPTLIACGDADMAPPRHYVEVFALLDGGLRDGGWMGEGRPKGGHALAVIPNATHYDVFMSPLLAASALQFIDAP